MRLSASALLPLALLALTACDGASAGPDDGPLELGIVSGNHQVATAGDDRLSDPVVGKLVRTPGGGIAFHLVTPAYAQDGTVVSGSPVPGAVVCAVSVTEGGMVPFTPCTNTESDGTATFFFAPGTKAGEARSEIRGTVEGAPAVFDTAVAEVQPGPVKTTSGNLHPDSTFAITDSLDLAKMITGGQDQYGNEVPLDSILAHVGWALYGDTSTDPTEPEEIGTIVHFPSDWCERAETHDEHGNCHVGLMLWYGDVFGGGVIYNLTH